MNVRGKSDEVVRAMMESCLLQHRVALKIADEARRKLFAYSFGRRSHEAATGKYGSYTRVLELFQSADSAAQRAWAAYIRYGRVLARRAARGCGRTERTNKNLAAP